MVVRHTRSQARAAADARETRAEAIEANIPTPQPRLVQMYDPRLVTSQMNAKLTRLRAKTICREGGEGLLGALWHGGTACLCRPSIVEVFEVCEDGRRSEGWVERNAMEAVGCAWRRGMGAEVEGYLYSRDGSKTTRG